jgi:hypothetical protein
VQSRLNAAPFDAVYGLTRSPQPDGAGVAGAVEDGVGVEDAMLLDSLLTMVAVVEVLDDTVSEEEALDEDKMEVGDDELVAAGGDELVLDELTTGGTSPAFTRKPALIIVWTELTPLEPTPLIVWHVLPLKKSISIQAEIVEQ